MSSDDNEPRRPESEDSDARPQSPTVVRDVGESILRELARDSEESTEQGRNPSELWAQLKRQRS